MYEKENTFVMFRENWNRILYSVVVLDLIPNSWTLLGVWANRNVNHQYKLRLKPQYLA